MQYDGESKREREREREREERKRERGRTERNRKGGGREGERKGDQHVCNIFPIPSSKELTLPEVPTMMNLLDERPAGKLCFSYHKGASISAIDEITAEVHRLTSMEPFKVIYWRFGDETWNGDH